MAAAASRRLPSLLQRTSAALLPLLLLLLLSCFSMQGAQANWITQTAFPIEGCKQDPSLSLYSASLLSYNLELDPLGSPIGSITCFLIATRSQAACRLQNKCATHQNTTHCCDVGLNKLKFYPNQACQHAVRGVTIKQSGQASFHGASMTYQNMGPAYDNQWVHKITPLGFTPQTANGTEICVQLGSPCPTLEMYAHDPTVLEFNLYSVKTVYECCPAGAVPVPLESFDLSGLIAQPMPPPAPKPKPPPKKAPRPPLRG